MDAGGSLRKSSRGSSETETALFGKWGAATAIFSRRMRPRIQSPGASGSTSHPTGCRAPIASGAAGDWPTCISCGPMPPTFWPSSRLDASFWPCTSCSRTHGPSAAITRTGFSPPNSYRRSRNSRRGAPACTSGPTMSRTFRRASRLWPATRPGRPEKALGPSRSRASSRSGPLATFPSLPSAGRVDRRHEAQRGDPGV